MKLDFHVHIRRDVRLSALRAVLRARKLDGIAITNFWDIAFAKWLQARLPEYFILVGKEVSTLGGHILAIGLERDVPDHLDPEETFSQIHDQGGLAIIPHPFLLSNTFMPVGHNANLDFDAIEVFNYRAGPFLWPNSVARAVLRRSAKPLLANTDSKKIDTIGLCYNDIPGRSREEIFANLRAGRVQRHTALQWPSRRWATDLIRMTLFSHKNTDCSVCGEELRFHFKKARLVCLLCGKVRDSHVSCKVEPHFVCKACRTRRDYAVERILRYRERKGILD